MYQRRRRLTVLTRGSCVAEQAAAAAADAAGSALPVPGGRVRACVRARDQHATARTLRAPALQVEVVRRRGRRSRGGSRTRARATMRRCSLVQAPPAGASYRSVRPIPARREPMGTGLEAGAEVYERFGARWKCVACAGEQFDWLVWLDRLDGAWRGDMSTEKLSGSLNHVTLRSTGQLCDPAVTIRHTVDIPWPATPHLICSTCHVVHTPTVRSNHLVVVSFVLVIGVCDATSALSRLLAVWVSYTSPKVMLFSTHFMPIDYNCTLYNVDGWRICPTQLCQFMVYTFPVVLHPAIMTKIVSEFTEKEHLACHT